MANKRYIFPEHNYTNSMVPFDAIPALNAKSAMDKASAHALAVWRINHMAHADLPEYVTVPEAMAAYAMAYAMDICDCDALKTYQDRTSARVDAYIEIRHKRLEKAYDTKTRKMVKKPNHVVVARFPLAIEYGSIASRIARHNVPAHIATAVPTQDTIPLTAYVSIVRRVWRNAFFSFIEDEGDYTSKLIVRRRAN